MTGKAHEVVKNFLTQNSKDGYAQAQKLLAERFGNPFLEVLKGKGATLATNK